MPSAFADMVSTAHTAIESVFADTVTIGTTTGLAIVRPEDDLMLGGGVEMIGGAHLSYLEADFPNVQVHDTVTHGTISYQIVEIDDADLIGLRKARLARS
jgi:hypothetical protein